MKIFIMVDMEGISGICKSSQVSPAGENYQTGRRYLTWDVNACVDGCYAGGAERVVVRDAHGGGYHFLWEDLDPRAQYIQGRTAVRMPGIEQFDGLILLGYHAMAGTPQAILEHTMSSRAWQNLWINGKKSGETAIDAGIAADHGVPTILVTGDDKCCAEARNLLQDVLTAEVKQGLDVEGGLLLSREEAHKRISAGAMQAVSNIANINPLVVDHPVTMRLELVSRGIVPVTRPEVTVVDGRTYEVSAGTVEEALRLLR